MGGEGATLRVQQHIAYIVAGRQHGDDGVSRLAEFGEIGCRPGGMIRCKNLRAPRIEIEADNLIAAAHKVGRHRHAHIAEADKADCSDVTHVRALYSKPISFRTSAAERKPSTPRGMPE